jgi:hypothetical protein
MSKQNMSPEVLAYLADIGRRGGAAGRGKPKTRPRAHYSRIAKLPRKPRKKLT